MKTIVLLSLIPIFITNNLLAQNQIPSCYDLVWYDEFNDTDLDLNKWTYQNGGWSASNVQNCYTPDNVSVSNGTLKITAQHEPGYTCFSDTKDFTSGFVQTKNLASWSFGYFEARVKVPASNSTWPAFWMSPETNVYGGWPQSGEIDIFEIKGHDMTTTYGNAHWGNAVNDKRQEKGPYAIGDADAWHVYGVEWKLGELKFYLDGVHYHTINDFREPNAATHPQPFDIPYYLRLNMAVGGDYLVAPHNDANNGINQLPATMEVDYVRVYQLNPACLQNDLITAKVLLEGFYDNDSNEMHTMLKDKNLIPLSQPFNTAPWNYAGTESAATIPHGVADWVLLRINDSNGNILSQAAGFINQSGYLMNIDNTAGIPINDALGNTFSVHHRSHLAISSATIYDGNFYDFTTSTSQAAGLEQLKLVDGKYMLYAGDYDGIGIINAIDFNNWQNQNAIIDQYLPIDGDGNGIINAADYNLWINNRSKVGQPSVRY